MRQRSHSLPGHRASQRPKARGRNRSGSTLNKQGKYVATNLNGISAVDATHLDLTFSQPVIGHAGVVPAATDFVLTAGGGTTRHMTAIVNTSPTVKRITIDGALTANKTYAGAVATSPGALVLPTGTWGDRTANIVTPP